ncbi:MAG: PEP-CTERM sorting domain-containing protein [Armatimonadetes bacterium]|nr:PEP-CTERM sorting domain-containing protein [Armatimonadota bacterium]
MKKTLFVVSLLSICLLASLGVSAFALEDWDYARDFSLTPGGPTSAWSYGAYHPYYQGGTQFIVYDFVGDYGGAYTDIRFRSQTSAPHKDWEGHVNKNTGSTPQEPWGLSYWEPGMAGLVGNSGPNATVIVRWTAPRAMTVDWTATFTAQAPWGAAGEGTDAAVRVMLNDVQKKYGELHGFMGRAINNYTDGWGQRMAYFQGQWTVNAGDKIDFTLLRLDTDNFGGSAGLAAIITEVPEPGSLLALGSAVIGLAGVALRRRR